MPVFPFSLQDSDLIQTQSGTLWNWKRQGLGQFFNSLALSLSFPPAGRLHQASTRQTQCSISRKDITYIKFSQQKLPHEHRPVTLSQLHEYGLPVPASLMSPSLREASLAGPDLPSWCAPAQDRFLAHHRPHVLPGRLFSDVSSFRPNPCIGKLQPVFL